MAKVPSSTFTYTGGMIPLRSLEGKINSLSSFSGITTAYKSETVTIPVAVTTTNQELSNFIPETALVTSLGIIFTEACGIGASGTMAVAFGTTSGGVDLVASTQIHATNVDIAQYVYPTTNNGLLATAAGTAIVMAAAAPLYFATQSSLWFRTIVGTAVLDATCDVKIVMEYIPEFSIGLSM